MTLENDQHAFANVTIICSSFAAVTLSHQNPSNEAETARNLQPEEKSSSGRAEAAAAEAAEWGRAVVAEAAIWPPRE